MVTKDVTPLNKVVIKAGNQVRRAPHTAHTETLALRHERNPPYFRRDSLTLDVDGCNFLTREDLSSEARLS